MVLGKFDGNRGLSNAKMDSSRTHSGGEKKPEDIRGKPRGAM